MSDAAAGPEPTLREVVEECLARYPGEGTAAIDELAARHPQHANGLRRRIDVLRQGGMLPEAQDHTSYPAQLGDFRLLELLGEGGMGAVFRARQESLGRLVALKVIRAESLFSPVARERFRREIEAVAALRSPGIVPVHTVGEENGVPFYAMELVEGTNLADLAALLRTRPVEKLTGEDMRQAVEQATARHGGGVSGSTDADALWGGRHPQVCCRIALRVARALAHAHERGVLHRDVKPSNIMVDAGGRVLLLDFGLARAVNPADHGLTQTGAVVGSLAYMAPEQIRGDTELDARVDVYGVGVTLYELLTLQRAYRGRGEMEELRSAILAGSVVTPAQLNPVVDRDAETICLRAMAPEPGRRYPTMAAMADDLQRFLELRPIEARRAGASYRVRRWMQRHPARATALAAGLLVAVGVPSTVALQQHFAAEQIRGALTETKRYQDSYERLLANALQTIEQTTYRLARDEQLATGKLDRLRRDLLEQTLTFYEQLASVADASPSARDHLRRAQGVLAAVRKDLGELDAARTAAQGVLAGYEADLAAAAPDRRPRLLQRIAQAARGLGEIEVARQAFAPAVVALDRSAAATRQFVAEAGGTPPQVVRHLLDVRMMRAACQVELGDSGAAMAEFRGIIGELNADPAALERDVGLRLDLVRAQGNLAAHLIRIGELEAAETQLRGQIAVLDGAAASLGDYDSARALRASLLNLGFVLRRRGAFVEADPVVSRAEQLAGELAAQLPDRVAAQREHASATIALAGIRLHTEGAAVAVELARGAVDRLAALAAASPDDTGTARVLAEARGTLAQFLLEIPGGAAEAIAILEPALATMRDLAVAAGATSEVFAHLGLTALTLALALHEAGQTQRVHDAAEEALVWQEKALGIEAGNPVFRSNYARTLVALAADAVVVGDAVRARATLQRGFDRVGFGASDALLLQALADLQPDRAEPVRALLSELSR